MKYPLPLIIAALVLLGACHAPASLNESEPVSAWTLQLEISGGIAGLQRSLQLDHSGQLTVLDRKSGRRLERTLTAAELAEIDEMLRALPESSRENRPVPLGGRCADCIESRLQVEIDGIRHSHTARSGATAPSPYDALRQHLSALLRQSLER